MEKVLGVNVNHTIASNSVVIIMDKVLGVSVTHTTAFNSVVIIMDKVLGVNVNHTIASNSVVICKRCWGLMLITLLPLILLSYGKGVGVNVNHTTASNSVVIWKRCWGSTSITLLPLILLSYLFTASLAYWLRCPPQEQKVKGRVRFLLVPWGFFWIKSHQWLKHWHSSGYPARRLASQGQGWDWSA